MTKVNDNRISNYPNGFPQGVNIRGLPLLNAYSGQVFWVNSNGGSDTNSGTFTRPRATIGGALALCVADRGDIIAVKSGHAESITAAAGLALNIAGVAIVGMGQGQDRPQITFSTATTASIEITAANVSLINLVGLAGINALANPINVKSGGDDCTIDMEWQDTATNKEALRAILATSVKRLSANLRYKGQTGGSANVNAIRLNGVTSGRLNLDYNGICTTAVVEFVTTACKDIVVGGYMYVSGQTGGALDIVDTITGSTWYGNVFDGAAGAQYGGGSALAWGVVDGSSAEAAAQAGEKAVVSSQAGVISNNLTLFTIAGGPIMVTGLCSICQTANDTTASTLQYENVTTLGSLTGTISGASATLASAVAGTVVTLIGTALTTAPVVGANGVGLMTITPILCQAGTIKAVVGVGSTTGNWKHYLRYKPLAPGVTVT